MNIRNAIAQQVAEAGEHLYSQKIDPHHIKVEKTNKDHKGDYTVVVFSLLRISGKGPEQTAQDIGNYLLQRLNIISSFNIIKGFLNLELSVSFWLTFLKAEFRNDEYGKAEKKTQTIVIEYCGPNTNKPLHLGHVRNMLLGWSLARILEFNGNKVIKVNMYNDRGIAICKSMAAWKRIGNNETPASSGIKGDHLVGKYYVAYDNILKKEIAQLISEGLTKEEAERKAPIYLEAVEMLRKWENGDKETLMLWKMMNDWVYSGFEETYHKIGVSFDKNYYESETYLLGKQLVAEGLEKGVFYKKEDGSTWVNLSDRGLDEKVLLRSDGTSVYLTQDLGTAQLRYEDFRMDQSIYVVANEQDYHFKVLKLTLEKLGKPYAKNIYHLSYGMVDLPSGKMKSREGTVVDADELIEEMTETAAQHTRELGKIDDFSEEEAQQLYRAIGLGALKFFILRVDPKKRMLFNPQESIDFHGYTGPFVQYTHARIQSVLRKERCNGNIPTDYPLNEQEKEIIALLFLFPSVAEEAALNYDPSAICNYVYNLAKTYNAFYHDNPILKAQSNEAKQVRLAISEMTARVIKSSLSLLGIHAPDKM
jgi:arginyl-tRNA synthetase